MAILWGRSSAWLERCTVTAEVAGPSPVGPARNVGITLCGNHLFDFYIVLYSVLIKSQQILTEESKF